MSALCPGGNSGPTGAQVVDDGGNSGPTSCGGAQVVDDGGNSGPASGGGAQVAGDGGNSGPTSGGGAAIEGVQVADITLGKTKARTGKLETMDDVYSVQDILAKYMERDDIQRLFIKLGLSETTVGGYHDIADKKKYARGLIVAWRNEQDDVLSKYPAGATWENLRNALIAIEQSGTAKKLE